MNNHIPTAHNSCQSEELIAKTVLMPGDPLRAKFIADNFLEEVYQFNSVRNMFGYTGTYKGKRISVMASGMGMPSIGIYAYELYSFYGVEEIIRIGSAGGYTEDLDLFDVLVATSAYSDSSFAKIFDGTEDTILYPSNELNDKIRKSSKELNIPIKEGMIYSSDVFYNYSDDFMTKVKENNCKAVEMESFALFAIANRLGKKAACILSISNSFVTGKETSSMAREQGFSNMIKLALNV